MRQLILLVLVLTVGVSGEPGKRRPDFKEFPARKVYRGRPAPPKLNKDQRMFRTVIRRGARMKVEFAGHYTVPQWGCGSACSDFAIVDSTNGTVYDGFVVTDFPLEWFEQHTNEDFDRLEFHPDSRLLKINGCPNEHDCGFYDYVMVEGKGLKLVRKELLPEKFQ